MCHVTFDSFRNCVHHARQCGGLYFVSLLPKETISSVSDGASGILDSTQFYSTSGTIRDFVAMDPAAGTIVHVGHRDYDAFGKLLGSTSSAGNANSALDIAGQIADGHLFGYTGREQTHQRDRYDDRMRSYDASGVLPNAILKKRTLGGSQVVESTSHAL